MNTVQLRGYDLPKEEPAPARGFNLRDLFQIAWRGRWLLGICLMAGAIVAYVISSGQAPQYRANASIMLDSRQQNVIDLESVLGDAPLNRQAIESELLVIRSDRLLSRVVAKLRLDRDPEFNPALRSPSEFQTLVNEKRSAVTDAIAPLIASIKEMINTQLGLGNAEASGETGAGGDVADAAASAPAAIPLTAAEQLTADQARAVRILRGRLRARQLAPAFAIRVSITSEDPVKAALIANTVADQYVVDQLEAKFEAARRATTWLTDRLSELRDRVEASEAAIQAYNLENRTGDSQAAEITRQQIGQVNAELITAKSELAQAQAQFQQARQMVARVGPAQAAVSLSSPLTTSLRGQRAELTRREAELSNRYGARHPTMIDLRNEIRDIDNAIGVEVRQIVSGLENQVRIAQARVTSLSGGLTDLEQSAAQQSEAGVALSQLEREAEANRQIYNNFLQRLNETREQEGFQTADSRVIREATPPGVPFAPKTKLTTALGAAAGLSFGIALIVLMQLLTTTYRSVASVSEQTGLRVLAAIPKLSRRRLRRLLDYVQNRPNSEFAEAARTLRNTVLSLSDGSIRSVLVASALPNEGKSTLSILLADMLGRSGKSVLLVDCDFRRPSLRRQLALHVTEDLVSLYDGRAPFSEVAIRPKHGHFALLALHSGQSNRADLLASERFAAMLAEWQSEFDYVIIDGPPVLGIGDFAVIGQSVGATVMAVQWNATPTSAFERALKWTRERHLNVIGAVVTKVDRRREAAYDTGSYGAEYAYFRRYYTN